MIPQRFSPLPFDAQTIGGIFAERMRVNLLGVRNALRFHFALSLC
jgi:hypothetical protein